MDRVIEPAPRLRGSISVPGDKSISHRAAIFNALAEGPAVIENFLPGDDCLSTLHVLEALGTELALDVSGERPLLRVRGRGVAGLREPASVLDCGNSGTTMRVMCGVLASRPFHAVLSGDASLRGRPMDRVVRPLRAMGARIDGRDDGERGPLSVRGGPLKGIDYRLPVASAQTKSALLLAGLCADGATRVQEPQPSRDHTERMLDAMGARVEREGAWVRISPAGRLEPLSLRVPNDISAAAFWMVAASVHPDAEIALPGVGVNPTRAGIIDALRTMGADIAVEEERWVGGEPVADIVVRSSRLRGITVGEDLVPRLIDEAPALAVAAAFAEGVTVIRDAAELRVKESDRIATTVAALSRMGVNIEERQDGMVIEGGTNVRGAEVDARGDHRLAMAIAAAALSASSPTCLRSAEAVSVSYPVFWKHLEELSGVEGRYGTGSGE